MKRISRISFNYLFVAFFTFPFTVSAQAQQQNLSRVDQMSDMPRPLHIIDYRKLALRFDSTVYDFTAKGKFWPLIWMDSSNRNFPQPVAGIYTAIGDARQGPANNKGIFHEALASMGAVLGATLVGIDKSNQHGLNYVGMLKNYFNKETGWNIMMNNTCPEVALLGGGYGRDWWYDVYPNVLFYAICDLYPDQPGFTEIARSIAERFYQADSILNGNYDYSFFDYGKMKPMRTAICAQPDAAAGHAWVLYAAYKKFGDPRYLKGALSALTALEAQKANPTYEVLMPFGAYLAARINAEQGGNYDVRKMLGFSFDGTPLCREGWGVLVGNWNGFDISGIVGSTVDHGGYGFLMNTYDAALPLIPMVRYDPSYANAIGKWMLHAANAARLFYPQYMPSNHQTIPQLAGVTKGVIGYEGMIRRSSYPQYEHLSGPVAQGDGPLWVPGKNPEESQFSVYGSAHAGIFGSIIRPTTVAGILQLDLLATDFYHDKAFPTYLYYNPYGETKTISPDPGKWEKGTKVRNGTRVRKGAVKAGSGNLAKAETVDLYNTVTHTFISRNVSTRANLKLLPYQAAVIVCVPSSGKLTYQGNKMSVNGIVVDFQTGSKE